MLRMPPLGMASRPLMARLRIASSNCAGSTRTGQRSAPGCSSTTICSPRVRRSMVAICGSPWLRSTMAGCSGWLREKASSRRVSSAPRSAPPSASWMVSRNSGSEAACSAAISRLPMMMPSRLLKSCATPPVSWPTASIFTAWRNCASIALRSVMSSEKPSRYSGLPSLSLTGTLVVRSRRTPLWRVVMGSSGVICRSAEFEHRAIALARNDRPGPWGRNRSRSCPDTRCGCSRADPRPPD